MKLKFLIKNNNIIFRAIFTLLCVILILYSLPHESANTNTTYREGLPWGYGQIITEFGFPVVKSEKQISTEKDSIRQYFSPYYNEDTKVLSMVLDSLGKYKTAYNDEVKGAISSYYHTGVISDAEYKQLEAEGKKSINIISNKVVDNKHLANIYTPSRIITLVTETLGVPEILQGTIKNALIKVIVPSLTYDEATTNSKLKVELEKTQASDKFVEKGQKIISRGDIVDHEKALMLDSYYRELAARTASDSQKEVTTIIGQALIIIFALVILFCYMSSYDKELKNNMKKFILTMSMTSAFPIMAGITDTFNIGNEYILPLTLTPMILSLFTDSRTSIISHTISVLICSLNVTNPYEFILLQLFAGYIATFIIRDLSSRLQMFHCVLLIYLTYSITYIGYTLITEKSFASIDYIMFAYFAINSIVLLFTYPLMFVVEQLFGFISSITLIELSNVNSKLLTKLSQNAPGTFQHSMQVGNLASEAAQRIGADSLLVRIGALYHDIGKMNNAIYFTENQNSNISPHSSLEPQESAKIIIKHVTDGIAIAEKHNLPRPIKDFILTHHGVTKPGVFYHEYKKQHPDEVIDDTLFTYPGPMPTTAEQGILMLADSVEAASKSLKEHTAEQISELVENIVNAKVKNGELNLCPLTFQAVHEIKECFKHRLMSIYHTRISYPKETTHS